MYIPNTDLNADGLESIKIPALDEAVAGTKVTNQQSSATLREGQVRIKPGRFPLS